MKNKRFAKTAILLFWAVLLLSNCINPFEPPRQENGDTPADGMGYVRVYVEGNDSGARTLAPPASAFTYTVIFEKPGTTLEEQTIGSGVFELSPGTWTVKINGYMEKDETSFKAGEGQGKVTVAAGQNASISVRLKPWTGTSEKGSLSYNVNFSGLTGIRSEIKTAKLTIDPVEGGSGIVVDLNPAVNSNTGTKDLAPGLYMVTVLAEIDENRFFTRSDLAHIYPLCEIAFYDIILNNADFAAKVYLSGTLPVHSNVGVTSVDLVIYENDS